jgi:hypothetical protein
MSENRKQCKECPYIIKNKHNEKFSNYVDKMFNSGIIKSKKHNCHMKGNVWSKTSKDTICIGSVLENKI